MFENLEVGYFYRNWIRIPEIPCLMDLSKLKSHSRLMLSDIGTLILEFSIRKM